MSLRTIERDAAFLREALSRIQSALFDRLTLSQRGFAFSLPVDEMGALPYPKPMPFHSRGAPDSYTDVFHTIEIIAYEVPKLSVRKLLEAVKRRTNKWDVSLASLYDITEFKAKLGIYSALADVPIGSPYVVWRVSLQFIVESEITVRELT